MPSWLRSGVGALVPRFVDDGHHAVIRSVRTTENREPGDRHPVGDPWRFLDNLIDAIHHLLGAANRGRSRAAAHSQMRSPDLRWGGIPSADSRIPSP